MLQMWMKTHAEDDSLHHSNDTCNVLHSSIKQFDTVQCSKQVALGKLRTITDDRSDSHQNKQKIQMS